MGVNVKMTSRGRIIASVALVVLLMAGVYIYRLIYTPVISKPDTEIAALKQELDTIKKQTGKDRIIIKEVILSAKQDAIQRIAVLSDDAVADELNIRLDEYRKRRDKPPTSRDIAPE